MDLNEKVAKWAGIKWERVGMGMRWVYPTGETSPKLLDFPNDLNACWEWLMPKWVKETGRDFITLPTTFSVEETALRICKMIELWIDGENE
ncbi:hypothetical protein LCGC14_1314130 [marine sediment metagenome]|uniref:Uncharacterized protein n=1 Tax=marine sediment metagenome TaxID=412755 RepID=A0A0F9KM18_9ZZZZ